MGNLDLINLSLNMSHFPSITISTFPEEKSTTIRPAIYALSKDPKACKFANPPLLAKIADRFKQINQQQNEDFIKEMTTSLPLSNANLQPDPSKIPSDFTRHVLDLIRKNEKMIARGVAPINLVETEIVKLRPSKRKFFMVQLMKQAAKENKLKNLDCLELGVHRSEVEKILKSSTKPEIIKKLNYYHKKMERSRRNIKRVNMLNLTQSMHPSVINLESHCNLDHLHDHSCTLNTLEVNEPRKSCYQVNHLNNVNSNTDIWIPKELIVDDEIHTDSSSCASIKSPCKRDNDNLSSLSGAIPNNRGCKDFKLVMAKKMQRAKMAMKQELTNESDSESEDMCNEIELFAPRRDSGELKMLSFPSTKTNSVNSIYNKERLSAMKKRSQRKLKRGFSTNVLGSNSQMSSISQVGGTNIKLPSMTSLHDIVEEKTPKENDEVNADLDEKIDKIVANQGIFGYAGNMIKNISNLHIGSNFVNIRKHKLESISNESSLSTSPIKKANSPTRTSKASLPPKAPTKRLPTTNGVPKRVQTKTKSFIIRTQSRESSIDRTLFKQDSLVTASVRPSKKKTSFSTQWNLCPTLNQFNVEKKELSSFITDTKNYYNFNMTQKDCFKLKLAQNSKSKESSVFDQSNKNNKINISTEAPSIKTINKTYGTCFKGSQTNFTIDSWKKRKNLNLNSGLRKLDIKFSQQNELCNLVGDKRMLI